MLVLVGGCALRSARVPLPRVAADTLLATLDARRDAVEGLRARVRLRAGVRGLWTREALLVRRPDAVRVDVLTPFGLALALGTREQVLWAYRPGEGVRYEGPATAANLTRFLGVPIRVGDIVDVLLGFPPAREASGVPAVTVDRGAYRVRLPFAGGEQQIWFAPGTLVVVRVEERRGGEAVRLRIDFDDYRDGVPHLVDVFGPDPDMHVRLAYEAIEQNATIDPALFAPPPADRVLPLSGLAG